MMIPHAYKKTALCVSLLALTATSAGAQEIPDLTDGFVRVDLRGSGGFDGLTEHIPMPQLTPAAEEAVANLRGRQLGFDFNRDPDDPRGPGEAYVVTDGGCNFRAGVLMQPDSSAFFITQTEKVVTVTREDFGARHIFMDGRAHPDLSNWTPSEIGHSTGWYEDGDLIVETVGLTPGGVTAGGYRSPETVLTERFSLNDDGSLLTVTYTWTDPEIYNAPHTYSLDFERLPDEYDYAVELWCDAGDPLNATSIIVPEQLN